MTQGINLRQTLTPEVDLRPISPTQLSPTQPSPTQPSLSSSPSDLSSLTLGDYIATPNSETIVDHPPYNLPSLGVVINLHFRVFICINCERAINSANLAAHVRKHLPLIEVSDDLPTFLENQYRIVPYNSVAYTPGPILPVFGVPLHAEPLFFCGCGSGYATYEILRTHQTRVGDRSCTLRDQRPGFHNGYGQRLTANRNYFEVDPSVWHKDFKDSPPYSLVFTRSLPPLRDYSTMSIKGAEDEMNTSSFFFTQRWLEHLEGYTPMDVQEVLKPLTSDAPYGERLRQIAESFLEMANIAIKTQNSFGILRLMGQTTE